MHDAGKTNGFALDACTALSPLLPQRAAEPAVRSCQVQMGMMVGFYESLDNQSCFLTLLLQTAPRQPGKSRAMAPPPPDPNPGWKPPGFDP